MAWTEFVADDSIGGLGGSTNWADEMDTVLPSAPKAAYDDDDGERRGGGFDRHSRSYDRHPRDDVQHPIPDEPPFVLFIGNLPFDLEDDDIRTFFDGSTLSSIRIIRDINDKPKGFGYVEFADRESIVAGLARNGESIGNRAIRVNVAEPSGKSHGGPREDRTAGEWRRAEPLTPTGGHDGSSRRSGFFRDRKDDHDKSEGASTWRRTEPLPSIDTSLDRFDGPKSARVQGSQRWNFRDGGSGTSTPVRDTAPDTINWRERPVNAQNAAFDQGDVDRRTSRFGGSSSRNESPSGRDALTRSYSGGLPRGSGFAKPKDTEWRGGAFQPRPDRLHDDRRISAPDTEWKGGAFTSNRPIHSAEGSDREGQSADYDQPPKSGGFRQKEIDTEWRGGAFKPTPHHHAQQEGTGNEVEAPAANEEAEKSKRPPPPPTRADEANTWRRQAPLEPPAPPVEDHKEDDDDDFEVECP